MLDNSAGLSEYLNESGCTQGEWISRAERRTGTKKPRAQGGYQGRWTEFFELHLIPAITGAVWPIASAVNRAAGRGYNALGPETTRTREAH